MKHWIETEIKEDIAPTPSDALSSDERLHQKRSIEHDYLEAEKLIAEDTDPLQHLWTLVARGKIEEAFSHIEISRLNVTDKTLLMELLLTEAKLKGMNADWSECLILSRSVISNPNTSITSRLTAYQLLSLSLLELGEFRACQQALGEGFKLKPLLPLNQNFFLLEIISVRVTAHIRSIPDARAILKTIWHQQSQISLKPFHLLSLIRLEIELLKMSNQPYFDLSLLSFQLAKHMGSDLHTGLAAAQVAAHKGDAILEAFSDTLLSEYRHLKRVQIEANQLEPIFIRKNSATNLLKQFLPNGFSHVFLKPYDLLIKLDGAKAFVSSDKPRLSQAIEVLSNGSIEKEAFFKQTWNQRVFRPLKHDDAIRALLKRLRKEFGIEVVSQTGVITAKNMLFISNIRTQQSQVLKNAKENI